MKLLMMKRCHGNFCSNVIVCKLLIIFISRNISEKSVEDDPDYTAMHISLKMNNKRNLSTDISYNPIK